MAEAAHERARADEGDLERDSPTSVSNSQPAESAGAELAAPSFELASLRAASRSQLAAQVSS